MENRFEFLIKTELWLIPMLTRQLNWIHEIPYKATAATSCRKTNNFESTNSGYKQTSYNIHHTVCQKVRQWLKRKWKLNLFPWKMFYTKAVEFEGNAGIVCFIDKTQ